MAEQRPLTEQEFNALVTRVIEAAPAGLDEATFQTMLDNAVAKAEQAVAAQSKRPEQLLAESEPDYMGNDPNLGTRALANAPAVGALAATMLGPAGFLPGVGMAMAGGAGGSLLRGDDLGEAATRGAIEGGRQLVGGGLLKGVRGIARGFMKGAVPKNIAAEYPTVNLPKEMLERGVFPGVPASTRRVGRLSTAANAERHAAAQTVPAMPRRRLIAGLKPLHAEATLAKEPEIAADMLEYMRTTARNVGSKGLTGPAALARKTVKQRTGRAALNAGSSKEAAVVPQLAEAERAAITSHLRETPRMAKALDESQILMAMDDIMRDASHTNPITRMRVGGVGAASTAPAILGVTAHGVNQGARIFDPQVIRALEMLLRSQSGDTAPRRRQP